MKFLSNLIIKHPGPTILTVIGITVFFALFIPSIQYDNDVTRMIPSSHPNKVFFDRVQEEFGMSNTIIIGIVAEDSVYRSDLLEKVVFLSDTFEMLDHVEEVLSISKTNFIEGVEGGLLVSPIIEDIPETHGQMQALKKKLMSWDVLSGNMVSEDGRAIVIGVRYSFFKTKDGREIKLDSDDKDRLYKQIEEIITTLNIPNTRFYIAGMPVVMSLISRYMKHDIRLLLPIVFSVVILLLFITLGNIGSVILIFLCIAISLVWTMGLMSLLQVRISLISTAIPVLLVAIGSAYAIHIIHRYSHERLKGQPAQTAVRIALEKVGRAVFMAAMTTMAGFGSLATSSIVPIREFGCFTAAGTFTSLIVSVFLIPAIIVIAPATWFVSTRRKASAIDRLLHKKLPERVFPLFRKRGLIVAVVIVLLGASVFFTSRIITDNDMVKYFKKDSAIRIADQTLNRFTGGTSDIAVYLKGHEADVFRNPDFLKQLHGFQSQIKEIAGVGKAFSFIDYIRRINYVMHENDPAHDCVPDDRKLIAQYLLLVSHEDYQTFVDEEFQVGRIVVQIKESGTYEYKRIINEIQDRIPSGIEKYVRVDMTGGASLLLTVDELVVSGQVRSIIVSIITVFLLASLVFRSVIGGLFTIVPLTLAVIINFGIMGLFRIPLEVGTAIIACIAIGVGVDYAIHYINAIRNAADRDTPILEACSAGAGLSGSAIIFNALSVGAGFMVLNLSSFIPLIRMGNLISLTMITASYGTLTLLPVLISIVKPKFIYQ